MIRVNGQVLTREEIRHTIVRPNTIGAVQAEVLRRIADGGDTYAKLGASFDQPGWRRIRHAVYRLKDRGFVEIDLARGTASIALTASGLLQAQRVGPSSWAQDSGTSAATASGS